MGKQTEPFVSNMNPIGEKRKEALLEDIVDHDHPDIK